MNKPVTVALLADAKEALRALADAVEELGAPPNKQVRIKALEGGVRSGTPNAPNSTSRWPATVRQSIRARPVDRAVGHARGHGLGFDGGNTAVWSNLPRCERPADHAVDVQARHARCRMGQRWVRPSRHRTSGSVYSPAMVHSACTPVRWESAVRLNLPIVFVAGGRAVGMVKMSQQIAAHPVATVARKMLTNKSLPDDQVVYADFAPCRYDLMAEAFGAHESTSPTARSCAGAGTARDCGRAAVVRRTSTTSSTCGRPRCSRSRRCTRNPRG